MQRILFLAEGQLGDVLLLTPAIRAVRESFPSVTFSVLVLDRRSPLLDKKDPSVFDVPKETCPLSANPNIDDLILVSRMRLREQKGIARIKSELAIIRCLRSRKFDTVISTFPEDRFAGWAFLSGAITRVGQRVQPLSFLFTHRPAIDKKEIGVLEYYCELVKALGAVVHSKSTEYVIADDAQRWADNQLYRLVREKKEIIAVHPGASGDYKIWPPERFADLIETLRTSSPVVLLRGPIDEPVAAAIRSHLRSPVPEIEIGNNVGNLAAVLRRCALCISNDSGPRHLAVAVGTPSLALFRQHQGKEWGSYEESNGCVTIKGNSRCPSCPPEVCRDRIPQGERFGSHCMRMIELDEVVSRVSDMLRLPLSDS